MGAVWMKSDLVGQDDGGQVLLDGDVGVGVPLHDLTVFNIPVPHPLAEAWAVIFQQVGFCEFSSLPVAKSSHSFGGSYHMNRVQLDFNPLAPILAYHVPWAPSTSILVYPYPDNEKVRVHFLKKYQRRLDECGSFRITSKLCPDFSSNLSCSEL